MANKLMVYFDEVGFATCETSKYRFLTSPPKKIGDEAQIDVGGKIISVMMLKTKGCVRNGTWLVSQNNG